MSKMRIQRSRNRYTIFTEEALDAMIGMAEEGEKQRMEVFDQVWACRDGEKRRIGGPALNSLLSVKKRVVRTVRFQSLAPWQQGVARLVPEDVLGRMVWMLPGRGLGRVVEVGDCPELNKYDLREAERLVTDVGEWEMKKNFHLDWPQDKRVAWIGHGMMHPAPKVEERHRLYQEKRDACKTREELVEMLEREAPSIEFHEKELERWDNQ